MKLRIFVACFIISASFALVADDSVPGIITTFAGNGTAGSGGDGGPAVSAQLNGIMGMAVDSAGNLYIADEVTSTIRKVTPDGMISTAVGSSAGLRNPSDVAVDASGNLYIADFNSLRVVKITPAGVVSTIASIVFPSAIASDPTGIVYVTDSFTIDDVSTVYKVTPDGAVSVLATGFIGPTGLALDSAGNIYVADSRYVLKVDPQGQKSIVAGCICENGELGDGGPATSAELDPADVAVDRAGNLFIADWLDSRIRMVTPSGVITTVAGDGKAGFSGDGGPATLAELNGPRSLAVDSAGNLMIGDLGNLRIRKVSLAAASESYFAHVAVGGGYYTTFALTNTGDSAIAGNLILTDQHGQPLTAAGAGAGSGSSFPVSIAPAGTAFLTIDPLDESDPVRSGWAKIVATGGTLSGVATFHLMSGGSLQTAAGVLPSQPTQYATIPVDDDYAQGRLTAYAVANPTSQNLAIKLALVDQEGVVVDDTVTFTLAPNEQIARYLYQDLARSQFKGSMVLRAQGGGSFVAVALLQNQKALTVIPVIPVKASSIPD
jgi:sugar lactone lactonase YvrE